MMPKGKKNRLVYTDNDFCVSLVRKTKRWKCSTHYYKREKAITKKTIIVIDYVNKKMYRKLFNETETVYVASNHVLNGRTNSTEGIRLTIRTENND